MHRLLAALEVSAHVTWKIAARIRLACWRTTGARPKFLSSKGQDRWVITNIFHGMRNGYFVELGAGDGFTGSDTFVLENDYGWSGICIEANPLLFNQIATVAKRRCIHVNACVDSHAGQAAFVLCGDTSGIVAADTDNNYHIRGARLRRSEKRGEVRSMPTQRLADILDMNDAPPVIHYLSLDVEGAEERILSTFPFGRYRLLTVTVERPTLQLHSLLLQEGFILARYKWRDGFYVWNELLPGVESLACTFPRKAF